MFYYNPARFTWQTGIIYIQELLSPPTVWVYETSVSRLAKPTSCPTMAGIMYLKDLIICLNLRYFDFMLPSYYGVTRCFIITRRGLHGKPALYIYTRAAISSNSVGL